MPFVSVVLNTYNRSDLLARAVESVLRQGFEDWELIVVDDGSTDDTPDVIERIADPRVRKVRHANMGLTASRNVGADMARGEWLAFLDDDDTVADAWLERLVDRATSSTGIVFCGSVHVDSSGRELAGYPPSSLGRSLGMVRGSILPGTWMLRRSVFNEAGGYLDGLPYAHQNELLIRAMACIHEMNLRSEAVDAQLFRYTVRPSDDRPMMRPRLAFDGARWIACRHHVTLSGDRQSLANIHGIAGVAAARVGAPYLARRHLWRAVRAEPLSVKRWLRFTAAMTGPSARLAWGRAVGKTGADRSSYPAVHALPPDRRRAEDHYFLPWRYERNPQASADAAGTPYWNEPSMNSVLFQEPVYRAARAYAKKHAVRSVLDVGTGSGVKLERYLGSVVEQVVGLDQGSAIELARERCSTIAWVEGDLMEGATWSGLGFEPELIICADVIEHVEDPVRLLHGIKSRMSPGAALIISTPDRMRYDEPSLLGPPPNARHVREWSRDEFELLLESCGLEIVRRHRFLPRGYRPTLLEVKRQVWRLLHRRAIPDRRYNAAWTCRRVAADS